MSALPSTRAPQGKWPARIAIAAAALLLAILAAAAAIHAWFDGDRLIALARAHAKSAWSRELEIGHLSLSLLPAPTLHAEAVRLSNPAWAQQPRLAEIDSLEVRLAIAPLLTGHIAPRMLSAKGLHLDLERDADGRVNWRLERDGSRVDWSRLDALHAEDAELRYRDGDRPVLDLSLPQADLHSAGGWRDAHLVATLARNGQTLHIDGHCDSLAQLNQAGATSDCKLAANADGAKLSFAGKLPLAAETSTLAATLDIDAPKASGLLAFLGMQRQVAPLALHADVDGTSGPIRLRNAHARLGATEAEGTVSVHVDGKAPRYEADISMPRLDWKQLLRDAGREAPGAPPPGSLFRHSPLPWPALQRLAGIDGRIRLSAGEAKLLSGIAFHGLEADIAAGGGVIDIHRYAMKLLGGSADGALRLDPAQHRARLKLDTRGVLLERWFSERGRKLPLSGGPMRIEADVHGHGDSMAALAATLDGAIDVHGGRTVIHSARAGEAEKLLTDMLPLFSERDAQQMTLECFSGRLRFANGRAAGGGIAGARSDVSQLLTSGDVDLRRQDVDLHGRVRARHGVPLGISVLTSDVRIHGPLKKPAIALDPAGAPGALARLGAAFLTGGLSIIATAAWDAANPATDACAAVFRHGKDR